MGRSGAQRKTQPAATPRFGITGTPESPRAQIEALGWLAPQATVEPDGDSSLYRVNANGLGLVDRLKTVGWYTAVGLSRAEAEQVAARADEISLLVVRGGRDLAEAYTDMANQHPAGALLASMFGPRQGLAPEARLRIKVLADGTLDIHEYDFDSWQYTLPAAG